MEDGEDEKSEKGGPPEEAQEEEPVIEQPQGYTVRSRHCLFWQLLTIARCRPCTHPSPVSVVSVPKKHVRGSRALDANTAKPFIRNVPIVQVRLAGGMLASLFSCRPLARTDLPFPSWASRFQPA
jgi:hypothetical protein